MFISIIYLYELRYIHRRSYYRDNELIIGVCLELLKIYNNYFASSKRPVNKNKPRNDINVSRPQLRIYPVAK